MSNEHSDSELNFQMAERKASRCGWHVDKIESSGDTGMKI